MKGIRSEIGRRGEDEACRYLSLQGHRIVARNWRSGHFEIDIVSLKGNELHITEVKTRCVPAEAAPEVNVSPRKARNVAAAAGAFLNSKERTGLPEDLEVFFDVATLLFDGVNFELEYYPQAFIPLYAE